MRPDYLLGSDPAGDFFNKARIEETTQAIAADLLAKLESGGEHLSPVLKRTDAYANGLTNGETMLALLRALSIVQTAVVDKLSGMNFGDPLNG